MQSVKRLIRKAVYPNPRGVSVGDGSRICRPRRIRGGEYLTMGDRAWIEAHSSIEAVCKWRAQRFQPRISIGSDVYIGRYFFMTAVGMVRIDDGCVLAEHVYITDCGHGLDPREGPIMERPLFSKGEVVIGARTFLGYRSCVLAGVELGENCVVGANSVVTRSFPSHSMVVGVPARLIKTYSPDRGVWEPVDG